VRRVSGAARLPLSKNTVRQEFRQAQFAASHGNKKESPGAAGLFDELPI
jgi:hypothetical protein